MAACRWLYERAPRAVAHSPAMYPAPLLRCAVACMMLGHVTLAAGLADQGAQAQPGAETRVQQRWPPLPTHVTADAGPGSRLELGSGLQTRPLLVVTAPGPFTQILSPFYHPGQIVCAPLVPCSCDASTNKNIFDGTTANKDSNSSTASTDASDATQDKNYGVKVDELGTESLAFTSEEDDAPPPSFQPVVSSQLLVEEFRAQTPAAPQLPPMVLSGSDFSERMSVSNGIRALALETAEVVSSQSPRVRTSSEYKWRRGRAAQRGRDPEPTTRYSPPPYNTDSLRLIRGRVTAHRADYSEPYTVWFDEKSGDARVEYHGGSTASFRRASPEGRLRRTAVWVERSSGRATRHCATLESPQDASARLHPALPDLAEFSFAGQEETPAGLVEVWQRTVKGRAGEQGAARGEVLTTRHEMRLRRVDGAAVPLRYTVAVDSSALGPNCDGYEHVYQSDTSQTIPPEFFDVDLETVCDVMENLNPSSAEDLAKLDPLREFVLPHRDLRYDQIYDNYRTQFSRQYADEQEEAVRKNVLMQSTRFITAGNRQGGTSELGATLLADRLRVEVRAMMGAEGAAVALAEAPGRDSFPYSRDELRAQERRLPSMFDWRALGAVSSVGFQGFNCSSCWAFAVSGAVEGALFRRTRRLVPLSYQCLVDCAHPFGGNGCSGTWPSHAYNYVQDRGLPALDEYPAYKEKVNQCMEQRVPSQTRITGHVNVTTDSVPALKVAIRKHAPSVVIVDAECQSFILHKKGVLYDDRCGKALRQLHHAVLAVGWGERRGEPHFILKNSWSVKWGEKGYIRVHARSNTCGVLTMPSYPLLEESDVRQPLRATTSALNN